jgi:hypothetical protein
VLLMAVAADPTETVILPLPPPLQGALTAGPYNFQFTGEDNFRLTVANSLVGCAVAVHYRTAPTPTTTQTNREIHLPTSDRLLTTKEFAVGHGYLLNVAVFASSGTPKRGQTWVKLEVVRGLGAQAQVLGTVVQGYVTANQNLSYPGSPMEASTDGDGYIREFFGTVPGLGLETSEACPTGARWEMLNYRVSFSTDATVINRRSGIFLDDGAFTYFRSPQTATQAGSQTVSQYWHQAAYFNPSILVDVPLAPLPSQLIMLAGHRIRTATSNMQPGDGYSSAVVLVREWLEV